MNRRLAWSASSRLWLMAIGLCSVCASRASNFTVTSTNDSGAGTLREAMVLANSNAGPDTIRFAIPAPGVCAIRPESPLPPILEPLVIDGYTQPGAAANTLTNADDAVLLIEIDGRAAGTNTDGFVAADGLVTIRGLVVKNFSGYGIVA